MKALLITTSLMLATLPYEAIGKATYYGEHWTGRKTASGERFHADSMTCAHKTLAFGTLLQVTDLNTMTSYVLKVNDRLPKSSGVLIDITYGAAKKFGIIKKGIMRAKVTNIGFRKIEK
jgi:rare lipoprotein A